MLYLHEIYSQQAKYFDEDGNDLTDSIDNFFSRKDLYGRRENSDYIAVPLVEKEWVLYSDEDLKKFADSNRNKIVKLKLAGTKRDNNFYLLPTKEGYSYFTYLGSNVIYSIHIALYKKDTGEIIFDWFYQSSHSNCISLCYYPLVIKTISKSSEDFGVYTVFYREGEWYLYTCSAGNSYEVKLKDLLET